MKRNVTMLSVLLLGVVAVLTAGVLWSAPPAAQTQKAEVHQAAAPVEAPSCTGDDQASSPGVNGPSHQPCTVTFCASAGVRCTFDKRTGCGCKYTSSVDPTCTAGEAPPPDFCDCI